MHVIRYHQELLENALHSQFVTVLVGPRRVGKSTLVTYLLEQQSSGKSILLNMDQRVERNRIEQNQLLELLEERAEEKLDGKNFWWIAIDEAQKCPALFDQIKVLYDRFKNQKCLKFILTGSGLLSLHQKTAESLAGRSEIYRLREFNLRESRNLLQKQILTLPPTLKILEEEQPWETLATHIENLKPHRPKLENALKELLVWGGLPEVLAANDSEKRLRYLANYIQNYLEKDVRALSTVFDLNLYEKIMEVIASQTGSLRDDKRLIQSLGCARDTLKKYRGYLEATLFYQEIFPYIDSSLKRLVKSPKAYLNNNGLISYLSGIADLEILNKNGQVGHRFENWFLKELQIWLENRPKHQSIYFWRKSSGVEVDFVVSIPPKIIPFEVTCGKQVERKKLSHLKSFLKEESKASFGVYLYQGEFDYSAKDRVIFLPAWTVG